MRKKKQRGLKDVGNLPRVSIALEYVTDDEILNFYVKKVTNAPVAVTTGSISSRARIFIGQGIGRKTWMGKTRIVSEIELLQNTKDIWRTLAVPRFSTIIFNEFFCTNIEATEYHRTMLRIQLCDVDKNNREVVVAETDFWIDTAPVRKFEEFELPMQLANPDLGEIEFSLTYMITAQRVILSQPIATNINLSEENSKAVFIRAFIYKYGKLCETQETEKRPAEFEQEWSRKLIFEVNRNDVHDAILTVDLVEQVDDEKEVLIGRCALSFSSTSTEHTHWTAMLRECRTKSTQIHKLMPAV